MSYQVIIPKSVEKKILKLPSEILERVLLKLDHLEIDARSVGSKKLVDVSAWSTRVGDYRIIYDIDDKQKIVFIRDVGHRRDIYR